MNRNVNELQQLLERWSVRCVVIAQTPYGPRGCNRGEEIGKFFQEWRGEEIRSFVILDDHADFGQFLPQLVHTRYDSGLTLNDVGMAMKILGEQRTTSARPTPTRTISQQNAVR